MIRLPLFVVPRGFLYPSPEIAWKNPSLFREKHWHDVVCPLSILVPTCWIRLEVESQPFESAKGMVPNSSYVITISCLNTISLSISVGPLPHQSKWTRYCYMHWAGCRTWRTERIMEHERSFKRPNEWWIGKFWLLAFWKRGLSL